MYTVRNWLLYITSAVGILLFLASIASIPYEVKLWWLKWFDFPRLQIFIASFFVLAVFIILRKDRGIWKGVFLLILLTTIAIQFYYIYPYTDFKEEAVPTVSKENANPASTFDLMIVNVLQTNRQAQQLINIIDSKDPDLILALETNQWWENALQPLDEKYPYGMEYPLDNYYGMILYSKYKLIDPQIKFLVYDSIPSFHTKVALSDGTTIFFHGVHPVPPVPYGPYNTNVKEKALAKVSAMIREHKLPAVVAGDLNDVAWADAARLFDAHGLVNDVREGREILPTYNARNPLLRWPLDYVYVTNDFGVIELSRLEEFGSDHFPVYVELTRLSTTNIVSK